MSRISGFITDGYIEGEEFNAVITPDGIEVYVHGQLLDISSEYTITITNDSVSVDFVTPV